MCIFHPPLTLPVVSDYIAYSYLVSVQDAADLGMTDTVSDIMLGITLQGFTVHTLCL